MFHIYFELNQPCCTRKKKLILYDLWSARPPSMTVNDILCKIPKMLLSVSMKSLIAHFDILEIEVRLTSAGGGLWGYAALHATLLHMKSVNETEIPISVFFMCLVFPSATFIHFIWLLCRMC